MANRNLNKKVKMKNYIYGAGHYSNIITKELLIQGLKFDLVIDKYTEKTELHGIPIVNSAEGLDVNANFWLIVSAYLCKEITDELSELGYLNFVPFIDALKEAKNCIPELVKGAIWYRVNQPFVLNKSKLKEATALLSDQKSITTLEGIALFRENPVFNKYIDGDADAQYFSESVPWNNSINSFRFIDCGAFTGDTLNSLVSVSKLYNKSIDNVILFEPNDSNRDQLIETASKYQDLQYHIYPCGVWSKNIFLGLSDNESASHITTEEDVIEKIMCVDIDSTLMGAKPNFIKMDIEGSEIEAILGAKEVIKKYTPILTIAIYHQPYDILDIPILINDINPGYNMYIRAHGDMTEETVLYCIPKKY